MGNVKVPLLWFISDNPCILELSSYYFDVCGIKFLRNAAASFLSKFLMHLSPILLLFCLPVSWMRVKRLRYCYAVLLLAFACSLVRFGILLLFRQLIRLCLVAAAVCGFLRYLRATPLPLPFLHDTVVVGGMRLREIFNRFRGKSTRRDIICCTSA